MTFEEVKKIENVEMLVKLSTSHDLDILAGVASNPNTPAEILDKLAKNTNIFVQIYSLENHNIPTNTLRLFVRSNNILIKF